MSQEGVDLGVDPNLPGNVKTPRGAGLSVRHRYRDSNPGFRRERAAS
jgi:hypothetical protein